MKKRSIIIFAIVMLVAVILFVPFRITKYDDGGTCEYAALTYKIVVWNSLDTVIDENSGDTLINGYKGTSVYWYPENQKSIDELRELEVKKMYR